MHVETPVSTALVSCDGLGGYDWSDQAKEDIKLLKVKIQTKDIAITELSRKLDLAQKEKDNYKKDLGYENYNAVPPPYTGNFMPSKPDLSFTGLDEFANKPVVENCDAKTSETKPKVVRKNNDTP
nr:hypothetical protein [Tanacetum cinerariifolium]